MENVDNFANNPVMRPKLGERGARLNEKLPVLYGNDSRIILELIGWKFQDE
jgi:hypothetical protein